MDGGGVGVERLRLLCCWGYSRAGWVAPLEALGAEHGFDLTYLFHRRPEEETAVATAWPRRYWREFRDAQQVLDELAPDRIVFMGLDGAWTIALNAVARARGIPTFLLQHGIEWPSMYASAYAPLPSRRDIPFSTASTRVGARLPALRFLARSLRRRPLELIHLIRLLHRAGGIGFVRAASTDRSRARLPDVHLVTGVASALAPVTRDGADSDEMVAVGLPELDGLALECLPIATNPTHALVIDSPLDLPTAEKRSLMLALGREVAQLGLSTTVKLHPFDHPGQWGDAETVRFARDIDLLEALEGAALVIGFESTLVLPAIPHRPVVLIATGPSWLTDVARQFGEKVIDGFEGVTAQALSEAQVAGPSAAMRNLLIAFAGPPPWSSEPLANAIRQPESAPRIDAAELDRMLRILETAAGRDRS